MKHRTKLNLQLYSALLLIVIGCGLLIAGFIVDPIGVIDPSVLTAFGETCTFGGALFGVDYHYRFKHAIINSNPNVSEE
nr:MAG TPA: hypothetical protein [Bacteriophage sp.]